MKRVLVVGSGAREHALAFKLAQEAEVFVCPGNGGMSLHFRTLEGNPMDVDAMVALARENEMELVVIGPEAPLIAGLADALRQVGIPTFGPSAAAAQLEASKAFSKELMAEAGVPTAQFQIFDDAEFAKQYAEVRFAEGFPQVIKASGAALGKGVVVANDVSEACDAIDSMLVDRDFGEAGQTIVVEDRLEGPEFSLFTLISDDHILSLPACQDYKRALDGDRGPNTGGMGSYCPLDWVSAELVSQCEETIVRPIIAALLRRGITYRGVLFCGLMMDRGIPHCLEFNVRFGDPETQSLVRRLGPGFLQALTEVAHGQPITPIPLVPDCAVTVVLAADGYPGEYKKGSIIQIGELPSNIEVFHAGTCRGPEKEFIATGGRVLSVTAVAESLAAARDSAYQAIERIEAPNLRFRTDIALF